jgi:hypothetical protein
MTYDIPCLGVQMTTNSTVVWSILLSSLILAFRLLLKLNNMNAVTSLKYAALCISLILVFVLYNAYSLPFHPKNRIECQRISCREYGISFYLPEILDQLLCRY